MRAGTSTLMAALIFMAVIFSTVASAFWVAASFVAWRWIDLLGEPIGRAILLVTALWTVAMVARSWDRLSGGEG